jgi:hypothetical protein
MQTNKNNQYITSHAEPSTYSVAVLSGLGMPARAAAFYEGRHYRGPIFSEKHVYGGTVPQATIDLRRAKNRVARKSRRINRLRAK